MKGRLVEGAKSFDYILIHLRTFIFIFFSPFYFQINTSEKIIFLATTFDLLEIDRWRID
jgi:hypothetical protein